MKKIFLFVCFVGLSYHMQAQIRLQKIGDNPKSVELGKLTSDADIYTVFGTPKRERAHQDEAADGYMKNYEYDKFRISTVDGKVYDFAFSNKSYEVVVNDLYKIRVGDSIQDFVRSISAAEMIKRDFGDEVQLFFKLRGDGDFIDESLILRFDSTGKVTSIRWFSPV